MKHRGFGPPLHSDDHEDDIFVVLDGEIRFECEGETTTVGAGGSNRLRQDSFRLTAASRWRKSL
ncbi:MAG: hypothetical protein ACKVHU_06995 [Acidimicrobiales bacterium]